MGRGDRRCASPSGVSNRRPARTLSTMSAPLVTLIGSPQTVQSLLGYIESEPGTRRLKGLDIFPKDSLIFNVLPRPPSAPQQMVACGLTLENKLPQRVYFRFKTNKPKRYTISPMEGILRPKSVTTVWVFVDPVYVEGLLQSKITGVVRKDDAILVTLVKLEDKFCRMYDALTSREDKAEVVSALGKNLRTTKVNGKVATWQKWLCTYVTSSHMSFLDNGGISNPSPVAGISIPPALPGYARVPRVSYGDMSSIANDIQQWKLMKEQRHSLKNPIPLRQPSYGERVSDTRSKILESKMERLSSREVRSSGNLSALVEVCTSQHLISFCTPRASHDSIRAFQETDSRSEGSYGAGRDSTRSSDRRRRRRGRREHSNDRVRHLRSQAALERCISSDSSPPERSPLVMHRDASYRTSSREYADADDEHSDEPLHNDRGHDDEAVGAARPDATKRQASPDVIGRPHPLLIRAISQSPTNGSANRASPDSNTPTTPRVASPRVRVAAAMSAERRQHSPRVSKPGLALTSSNLQKSPRPSEEGRLPLDEFRRGPTGDEVLQHRRKRQHHSKSRHRSHSSLVDDDTDDLSTRATGNCDSRDNRSSVGADDNQEGTDEDEMLVRRPSKPDITSRASNVFARLKLDEERLRRPRSADTRRNRPRNVFLTQSPANSDHGDKTPKMSPQAKRVQKTLSKTYSAGSVQSSSSAGTPLMRRRRSLLKKKGATRGDKKPRRHSDSPSNYRHKKTHHTFAADGAQISDDDSNDSEVEPVDLPGPDGTGESALSSSLFPETAPALLREAADSANHNVDMARKWSNVSAHPHNGDLDPNSPATPTTPTMSGRPLSRQPYVGSPRTMLVPRSKLYADRLHVLCL